MDLVPFEHSYCPVRVLLDPWWSPDRMLRTSVLESQLEDLCSVDLCFVKTYEAQGETLYKLVHLFHIFIKVLKPDI